MSKRSLNSDMVTKFTNIYRAMNEDQLQDEFDALSDQLLGFLMAAECMSIEVMYDNVNSLKCEFIDMRGDSYKEQMN